VSRAARACRSLAAAAGLFTGAAAWLANTQLNYALVSLACSSGFPLVPLVSAAMLALALGGGWVSWRARSRTSPDPEAHGGSPDRLLGATAALASLLFGAVILLQGAAGLVFSGCER
jgi:hypothetical protein